MKSGIAERVKLGPVLCVNCAQRVGWWLVDGRWILRNWSDRKGHECPA